MIQNEFGHYYFTLNEIYRLNRNIEEIFEQVSPFFGEYFDPITLFKLYKYKHGNRHINYVCFNKEFTDEMCDEVKELITMLYKQREFKYDKLWRSETIEYNPIKNYDMVEEGSDVTYPDLTDEITYNSTQERSPDLEKTTESEFVPHVKTQVETDNTVTDSVSAYDAVTFANDKQAVTDSTITTTPILGANDKGDETSTTETETGKDTTTHTGTDTTTHKGSNTITHHLERSGNIGVTTTQQMLEQERNIADFSTIEIFFNDIAKAISLIY